MTQPIGHNGDPSCTLCHGRGDIYVPSDPGNILRVVPGWDPCVCVPRWELRTHLNEHVCGLGHDWTAPLSNKPVPRFKENWRATLQDRDDFFACVRSAAARDTTKMFPFRLKDDELVSAHFGGSVEDQGQNRPSTHGRYTDPKDRYGKSPLILVLGYAADHPRTEAFVDSLIQGRHLNNQPLWVIDFAERPPKYKVAIPSSWGSVYKNTTTKKTVDI